MKKLACTQCGAKINPNNLICDYCGAAYINESTQKPTSVIEDKKNSKKNKPNVTDDFLIDLLNSTCKENKFSNNIVPIMFMVFWIMICVFIFIFTSNFNKPSHMNGFGFGFSGFGFLKFIPLLFIIIGVSITIRIIKRSIPFKLTECTNLIKEKRYEEAFGWLKSKNDASANKNYVFAMIIVCYYRLDDEDLVRMLYTKLSYIDVTTTLFKNSVISTIAADLNIKIPTQMFKN